LERVGDDERDRLTVVEDPVVLQDLQLSVRGVRVDARRVLVREHAHHAGHALRLARIDRGDAARRDRAGHHHGVRRVRDLLFVGVAGGAGDLRAPVLAVDGCADHAAPPTAPSARAIALRARSVLKPFSRSGFAAAISASAAARYAARDAGFPISAASARFARHGTGAIPPTATRASRIVPPRTSSAAAADTRANSYD